MAHAREAVKFDVVFGGDAAKGFLHLAAQGRGFGKQLVKSFHRLGGLADQFAHQRVAGGICLWRAAFAHFCQAVVQRVHQGFAPLGVV